MSKISLALVLLIAAMFNITKTYAQTSPIIVIDSFNANQITGHTLNPAVDKVELAIRDTNLNFWNGSTLAPSYTRVTTSMQGNTWSYTFTPALSGSDYFMSAIGFINNQAQYPFTYNSASVAQTRPTTSITQANATSVTGTSSNSAERVDVIIRTNDSNPLYWDGQQLIPGWRLQTATTGSNGNWQLTGGTPLPTGNYIATSSAVDVNGLRQAQPFTHLAFTVGGSTTGLDCGNTGQDGEGCADYIGPTKLTVGEKENWRISFKAGDSGIPAGGGISIGFHHASSWWVQTSNPANRHYVTATGPVSLAWKQAVPLGMFERDYDTYNPDFIFHRLVIATATQDIAPGEVIEFHFGASPGQLRTQNFADPDHQFRVATDVDGDGAFLGIATSPTVEIVHATAENISAVIPSQVVKAQPFEITILVEDEFYNRVDNYNGLVDIIDENGVTVAEDVSIVAGLGKTQLAIGSTGAHRLRIQSTSGALAGRSNPTRVFNTMPQQKLYWGELHGHTGESDGLGLNADQYFEFGCNVAALDFIALTDHGIPNWPDNIAAVRAHHQPGDCVTILATEQNSRFNPRDHNNLYFRHDDATPLPAWSETYIDYQADLWEHYNKDHSEGHAISGPHHSGYDRGFAGDPNYPFVAWDERSSRYFEVYSSHGTSEYRNNPRPLATQDDNPTKYMQGGLDMGHKFAVIAASDNHDSKPGRSAWGTYPGGLAAVWANNLDRDSVFDALWDYHTYGSSADRIYVEFSIDGAPMGSTINGDGIDNINIYVIGKTDNLEVELVSDGGAVLQTWSTTTGVINTNTNKTAGSYYYLRVTQSNGERAWSTPVWVE